MRGPGAWIGDHWRGRLPLALAIAGPLVGGQAAVFAALNAVPVGGRPATTAALAGLAVLTIWQVVGTFRAADRAIRARGSMALVSAGYGAMLVAAGFAAVQAIGLIVPDWRAAPYAPPRPEGLSVAGDTVALEGEFTLALYAALGVLLEETPGLDTLLLDSEGGSVYAARGMARLVAANGLATRVEGRCYSACTLVFMAGARRDLAPGGELGFHRYATGTYANLGSVTFNDPAAEQEKDRAWLRGRGVSEAFLARIYDAGHGELWRPERDELVRAGVIAE